MAARPIRYAAPATTLDAMAVIEVHELQKRYGETVALDGVSFGVQAGEVFGLLGPNGAGKTTAVEIMEGLRTPDSGTVRVLGLDPERSGPQLRERVGVQLQQAQLQEKIRVGEALELYAGFYRNPRPVDELLDEWLAAKRNTAFKKLSGGQQQRLFLALALLGRPELVFFDEITTGLDPAARRQTWDLVRRVRDSGVTVVLVSHLMDEVEELCDRVAILDRGRLVALDTPTGLITSSGSEQRMRFRPVGVILAGLIEDVPGVTAVTRSGSQLIVTGSGEFATGVTAALGRAQVLVADLRLEQRTLDDAFVALTGRPFDDAGDTTHDEKELEAAR
jgi:ABC-2 type transport system ATP-binding protein